MRLLGIAALVLTAAWLAASPGPSAAGPLAAPPPVQPQPAAVTAPGSAPTAAEAAVRDVLDAQLAAWNRGDLEGFMQGYWRSPELVFCSGATVTKGWEATLTRYRKRYQSEGREMGRLRFEGLEVLALGPDAAAARGAYRLRLKDGTEPYGLFTLLLRRLDGEWRIVHDHTSTGE